MEAAEIIEKATANIFYPQDLIRFKALPERTPIEVTPLDIKIVAESVVLLARSDERAKTLREVREWLKEQVSLNWEVGKDNKNNALKNIERSYKEKFKVE